MNKNDTDPQQIDLFGTSKVPTKVPPSATAQTAIRRTVRTLATVKNFRKQASIDAACQARNAGEFFKAWSELKVEADDLRAKNQGLLHAEKGSTAKAFAPSENELTVSPHAEMAPESMIPTDSAPGMGQCDAN